MGPLEQGHQPPAHRQNRKLTFYFLEVYLASGDVRPGTFCPLPWTEQSAPWKTHTVTAHRGDEPLRLRPLRAHRHLAACTPLFKVFRQRAANNPAWRAPAGAGPQLWESSQASTGSGKPRRSAQTHRRIIQADGNLLITIIAASH